MVELLLPDIAGAGQRGAVLGTQLRLQRESENRRNMLSDLSAQAYTASPIEQEALVSKALGVDAQSGLALQKGLSSAEDDRTKRLMNIARAFVNAPEEARASMYQEYSPYLRRIGIQGPDSYDTPENKKIILDTAQGLVKAGLQAQETPTDVRSFEMMTSGLTPEEKMQARKYAVGLESRPTGAAIIYKEVSDENGRKRLVALDPREVGAHFLGGGQTYGSGVGLSQPTTSTTDIPSGASEGIPNFGIDETNKYVRSIMGKVGQVPQGASSEQLAALLLPFVMQQESGGNPGAVSPKGAQGLMQVMPATASNPGLGVRPAMDNSPGENLRLGYDYLNALLKRYNNNLPLALAAYNGGMGVADRFANPSAQANTADADMFTGQSAADEAAAKKRAELQAQIDAQPTLNAQAADAEAAKIRAKAQAEADMAGTSGSTAATITAATEQAKDASERFKTIQAKADMARSENARMQQLRSLLANTYTGTGANAVIGAKKAAAALGLDVENLGDAEAARALSNQIALGLRNPSGGEGMPGNLSDSDRNFLVESVPSVENSPSGWRTLINMKIGLNNYSIRQAQVAEQMRQSGIPVQDIPGKMQEWAQKNPLFKSGAQKKPRPSSSSSNYNNLWGG